MTDTAAPAIAPGWYPDPASADAARWWDGERWTAQTRPRPAPRIATPAAAPASTAVVDPSAHVAQLVAQPVAASIAPVAQLPVVRATPAASAVPPIPVPPWATQYAATGPAGVASPATASAAPGSGARMWGPSTTSTAWVIAALPLPVWFASNIAAAGVATTVGWIGELLALVGLTLGWIVSLILAVVDARTLRSRGVGLPASPAWMLLAAPIVWLAVRASRIRQAGGRSIGPLILGSISAGVCLLLLGIGVAMGASRAATLSGSGDLGYGAYEPSGEVRTGLVPSRTDVGEFVTASEDVRDHVAVHVNCGFGPIPSRSQIVCASRADGPFTPLTRSVVVDLEGTRILRYSVTALSRTTSARAGAPASVTGAHPSIGLIVTTTAVGDIAADGAYAGSAPLTGAMVNAFARANIRAAGLDWTEKGDAHPEFVFTRNGTDDGDYVDAQGQYWEVDVHVDYDGGHQRIWVYAEET